MWMCKYRQKLASSTFFSFPLPPSLLIAWKFLTSGRINSSEKAFPRVFNGGL